ncbi:MAG: hypothetical protein IPN30_06550 [Flavobacteriales bacterium]|nr:hypothetical protein [Flavobacteriales bacterium]
MRFIREFGGATGQGQRIEYGDRLLYTWKAPARSTCPRTLDASSPSSGSRGIGEELIDLALHQFLCFTNGQTLTLIFPHGGSCTCPFLSTENPLTNMDASVSMEPLDWLSMLKNRLVASSKPITLMDRTSFT